MTKETLKLSKKLINSIFIDEASSLRDHKNNVNEQLLKIFINTFDIKVDEVDETLLDTNNNRKNNKKREKDKIDKKEEKEE